MVGITLIPKHLRSRGSPLILATAFVLQAYLPALVFAGTGDSSARSKANRPNFVFILIDDMRWDVMSCAGHRFVGTPNIDRIATAGVRFTNAFVTTSLCSPSRASFLTGCHARTHGVRFNAKMDLDKATPTFPRILRDAGYDTAFVGKWHMSGDPNPRPGFDYWLSFYMQGEYIDPELNENGRTIKAKGYVTDLLTDYAADYLKGQRRRPFCLILSHKAMHADFTPAERHKNLYRASDLREPISWSDTMADKPQWLREVTLRGGRRIKPLPPGGIPNQLQPTPWDPDDPMNQRRLNWYRTLAAVDESVGRVLDTLRASGADRDTYVIFASDNGFFLGEHQRMDKRLAYEESIRIPMLISGPAVDHAGGTIDNMVLNIDVAPTILDLAGVAVPAQMQGLSLQPLLTGKSTTWRTSFLYEYFREDWLPGIPSMVAVRTERWKYIRYPDIDDLDEMYDLIGDPNEMRNLATDPTASGKLSEMQAELKRLMSQAH